MATMIATANTSTSRTRTRAGSAHEPRPHTAPGLNSRNGNASDNDKPDRISRLMNRMTSRPSTVQTPPPAIPLPTPAPSPPLPKPGQETLEISLANDGVVVLKGTGSDIEPGLLSGTVILTLTEPTAIKEIHLQLRAKSRIIPVSKDGQPPKVQAQTTVLFSHSWDLLALDKTLPHTLKAGRHEFPFQLFLGASAPASVSANAGYASVYYKLRANAVRPSLALNFTSTRSVSVIRTFSNEALEYQQTLEIENTWPEKIIYAVILPHKAWAAGDNVSARLKFTPLAKGVRVVSIRMALQEKVKTLWKMITHEEFHVVASTNKILRQSIHAPLRSLLPEIRDPPLIASLQSPPTPPPQPQERTRRKSIWRNLGTKASREFLRGIFRSGNTAKNATSAAHPPPNRPHTGHPPTRHTPTGNPHYTSGRISTADPQSSMQSPEIEEQTDEIETTVRMKIPHRTSPTNAMAPLTISHRIKWDVLLLNRDGHHSELRCSLPIHVLAHAVLDEARAATRATRTALFGPDGDVEEVQEILLPAYHDHIRDRVANAELHSHILATNPLNSHGVACASGSADMSIQVLPHLNASTTTLRDRPSASHIHRVSLHPESFEQSQGDAVATELQLSLGHVPPMASFVSMTPSESRSRPHSRTPSRSSSRASSPERAHIRDQNNFPKRPSKLSFKPFKPFSNKQANRSAGNLNISRPSTGSSVLSTRPGTPSTDLPPPPPMMRMPTSPPSPLRPSSSSTSSAQQPHVYDAIPDYATAARGFLGGGITPLSMLRGLPSYADAQRVPKRAESSRPHTARA